MPAGFLAVERKEGVRERERKEGVRERGGREWEGGSGREGEEAAITSV